MNKVDEIIKKSLHNIDLTIDEALFLYNNLPLSILMQIANEIRKSKKADNKVTWIVDRNVNITNVCVSGCKFCNFHCSAKSKKAYITTIEQYIQKIEELHKFGGNQLLLQGGMHPDLGLNFYTNLFKELKDNFPNIKLHALGPPEIAYIAKKEKISFQKTLEKLIDSGLDSLPGAGAEILSDRVRKELSKNKCSVSEWLEIMKIAHRLDIITSATMMFGHIETIEERLNHLILLRDTQNEKPKTAVGFISFTPWPFQDNNTVLKKKNLISNNTTANDYVKLITLSRIILNNIDNIQASWLTVGKPVAQVCLHAGANDFGSIMIEENVVSQAGATYSFDAVQIQKAIKEVGFIPQLRNQKYDYVDFYKKGN